MINWIKTQIERILNYFGYYKPISDTWFEKPEITPPRKQEKDESWSDYWDEFYQPHYNAWYMRCISEYPKILQSLLYEISVYDWDDIAKHMKDTNWYWSNLSRSPFKNELIETVVGLTHNCMDGYDFDGKDNDGYATGGFKVSIKNEEVIIEFEKDLHNDW